MLKMVLENDHFWAPAAQCPGMRINSSGQSRTLVNFLTTWIHLSLRLDVVSKEKSLPASDVRSY